MVCVCAQATGAAASLSALAQLIHLHSCQGREQQVKTGPALTPRKPIAPPHPPPGWRRPPA